MGQVWHWMAVVVAWHLQNVSGNWAASGEVALVAVLVGRPIYRRAQRRERARLVAEMQAHVATHHERTQRAIARLLGVDPADPDGDGVAGLPERKGENDEG